jgi:hypothetical protein
MSKSKILAFFTPNEKKIGLTAIFVAVSIFASAVSLTYEEFFHPELNIFTVLIFIFVFLPMLFSIPFIFSYLYSCIIIWLLEKLEVF